MLIYIPFVGYGSSHIRKCSNLKNVNRLDMYAQIQWFIVETERDSGYNSMTQSYSHEKTRPIKFPTLTA